VTGKASGLRRPARPRKKVAAAEQSAAASADAQAAAAYAALVRRFADQPRVTLPADKRGKFGSNALKVDGKIFGMLVRGALAVKLSPEEVESATRAGRGEPLAMGASRVMKGWLLVNEPSQRWYAVAERARAFVAGERRESRVRASRQGLRLPRPK
jgi:hypothetical protein